MTANTIADILVEKGKGMFDSTRVPVRFTGNNQADGLLNDLENSPHAFVLACVMDRQIKGLSYTLQNAHSILTYYRLMTILISGFGRQSP